MRVGFVGTGGIAEAMVTGLCRAPGATDSLHILVSRRSEERSSRLRKLFPDRVEIVADNQEIVDRCRTIVIAVKPEQAEEVMTGLRFREEHRVLSLIAGMRVDRVRSLVAPAGGVFRAIPMPPVERCLGPVPLLPPDDELTSLLGRIGTVIPVTDERQFQALAASSALMASYFEIVAETAAWLEKEGVPDREAARYATSMFVALSSLFDGVETNELAEMSTECLTAGGLNEQVLTELRDREWFGTMRVRLDRIMARMDRM
jgi:pyrroline-5-carboxylate reductase